MVSNFYLRADEPSNEVIAIEANPLKSEIEEGWYLTNFTCWLSFVNNEANFTDIWCNA